MASYSADCIDWVGEVKVEASLSGLVSRDGGTGSGKIKKNQVWKEGGVRSNLQCRTF